MVAPAGAGPWPQITSVRPRFAPCTMIGTSPPGPFRCGSTTCRVKAVATAASNALPPFSRIPMPTAVAIQWVEVTTPNMPSISGRVVKGSGLMWPMAIRFLMVEGGAIDHRWSALPTALRFWRLYAAYCGLGWIVDCVAGDAVDQRRCLAAAAIEDERAARIEGAAGRRVDRVRDLPFHG